MVKTPLALTVRTSGKPTAPVAPATKYPHYELLGYVRLRASIRSCFSSAACGVFRKLIAMRL